MADALTLRSLLFVPANRERMIARAAASSADAIVLDLEDAVPADDKQLAREQAAAAVPALAASGKPVFVRLNALTSGLTRDDVQAVVQAGLAGVVLPKTQSAQDLRDLDVLLREAELAADGVRPGDVRSVALIESAAALLRCEDIARATDRLLGLALGAEDYTLDLGVPRDGAGPALSYARGVIANVATAYGLLAIDTPYAEYRDARGLLAEAKAARASGMKAKLLIHPEQAVTVNRAFAPDAREMARARAIVDAWDAAQRNGVGVITLDGAMIDAPVVARARAIMAAASRAGARKRVVRRRARGTR